MAYSPAIDVLGVATLAPPRRWEFLRWLIRRKIALLSFIFLVLFYFCGLFARQIAPYDPNQQTLSVETRRAAPSPEHIFGTDALGRDLFSRVLYAAQTTIIFTIVVVLTGSLVLGLGLGLLAGYRGGWVDTVIMRVGEVLSAMPTLILMLAISAAFRARINDAGFWLQDHTVLGDSGRLFVRFAIVVGVTVLFSWVGGARFIRGQVLAIREKDFITSAESIGCSTGRIVWRHVFPGILPIWVVGLSSSMAGIGFAELGLSFLGLGIDPPAASFGTLIGDSLSVPLMQNYPHLILASAGPITIYFFAWNLLGDALVDYLEPRSRRN